LLNDWKETCVLVVLNSVEIFSTCSYPEYWVKANEREKSNCSVTLREAR